MPTDDLRYLDAVARRLPFDVDDFDAANAAFARWREGTGDRRPVDLWMYCYIHRYFLIRFLRERGTPSDLDQCTTQAFERVRKGLERIEDPAKFANYVSKACKNAISNHRRDRRDMGEVYEDTLKTAPEPLATDGTYARHIIETVLDEAPEAVRDIGRLRVLEQLEYTEIAERTGHELPTVRTYAWRAAKYLRADPRIRALHYDDVLPPGVLDAPSDAESENL